MSDFYYPSNEYVLQHYGVKGMKWGVRRAERYLSKGTDEGRKRGKAILSKHKGKVEKKINKLDDEYVKLEKKRNKQIQKDDVKAASIMESASKTRDKAYGRFKSYEKSQKLLYEADKLEAKANKIKSRSDSVQAQMDKNRSVRDTFNKGLGEIDEKLIAKGRRLVRNG